MQTKTTEQLKEMIAREEAFNAGARGGFKADSTRKLKQLRKALAESIAPVIITLPRDSSIASQSR